MNRWKSTQALGVLAAFCASATLVSAADGKDYAGGVHAPAAARAAPPAPARLADEAVADRYAALGIAAALLAFAFWKKKTRPVPSAIIEAELAAGPLPPPAAQALALIKPAVAWLTVIAPPQRQAATKAPAAAGAPGAPPVMRGNVVVPVDFSQNSALAIRLARVWSTAHDRLRVVYAVDLDNAFPAANLTPSDFIAVHPAFAEIDGETAYHWSQLPWVVVLPKALDIVERWAVNEFAKLAQTLALGDGENLEFQVLRGEPVKQIVGFSEAVAARLIVLVAHQHSPAERLISGSHADAILHASRIPVLLACEPMQVEICLPREIVITSDYSPESLPVFLVVMDLLRGRRPNITVLTVEKPHAQNTQPSAKLEGLQQAMLALGLAVDNVSIVAADAQQGILDYLQKHPPQLVAMSSHGRLGFAELVHPSVTKAILHGSGIPLLVAHSGSMPTAKTLASLADLLRIVTG